MVSNMDRLHCMSITINYDTTIYFFTCRCSAFESKIDRLIKNYQENDIEHKVYQKKNLLGCILRLVSLS